MLNSTMFTHAGQEYTAGIMPTFGAFRCKIYRGKTLLYERLVNQFEEFASPGLITRTLEQMIEDVCHGRHLG